MSANKKAEYQDNVFPTDNCGDILVVKYNTSKDIQILFLNTDYLMKVAASQIRSGKLRDPTHYSTVFDWGIIDVDYHVTKTATLPKINGKRVQKKVWVCPYYQKWYAMLGRVFSHSFHKRRPNYKGCSIYEGWRKLNDFIKWVDSQPNKDWENCEPDKDLLFPDNKIYCPDTVVFVDHVTNKFILDSASKRGECLLGVDISRGKFRARCKDPFNLRSPWIGYFTTELEAHKAWQKRKHEYACMLAERQTDERVAFVLRNKYTPDKDWTNR